MLIVRSLVVADLCSLAGVCCLVCAVRCALFVVGCVLSAFLFVSVVCCLRRLCLCDVFCLPFAVCCLFY